MHARSSAARGHRAQRLRHVVPVLSALSLAPLLAGCFVNTEKPELAVDIPEHYRFAGAGPEANLPALDWWRGFRSPELTQLIEEAQTSNLDIAVAVARIMQADAQARIAGAPLLPNISGLATAAHSLAPVTGGTTTVTNTGAAPDQEVVQQVPPRCRRRRTKRGKRISHVCQCELHRRFLGAESRVSPGGR